MNVFLSSTVVRPSQTPAPPPPPANNPTPCQPLGGLYTEVGNAVLDSTDEVPSMFHERRQKQPRQRKGGTGVLSNGGTRAAAAAAAAGGARGVGGRAVLDVAMPGAMLARCGRIQTKMDRREELEIRPLCVSFLSLVVPTPLPSIAPATVICTEILHLCVVECICGVRIHGCRQRITQRLCQWLLSDTEF